MTPEQLAKRAKVRDLLHNDVEALIALYAAERAKPGSALPDIPEWDYERMADQLVAQRTPLDRAREEGDHYATPWPL